MDGVLEKIPEFCDRLVAIRECVPGLPQGPRESSTVHYSYASQFDYEIYQEELKKQGASISKLERTYSSFIISQRDLRASQEKKVERVNKREKFLYKIQRGVKGIFKVLKPKQRLPSPSVEIDDRDPAKWSCTDDDGDNAWYTGDISS